MSAKLFAVLGAVLIGGAVANEVTNIPVRLPVIALMILVGLGGLCVAAFLVIEEMERQDAA